MSVRLARFEMPNRLTKDESTATDTYSKFIAEPFENIQVYNLMCRILGLTPAKNDGNLDAVRNILK